MNAPSWDEKAVARVRERIQNARRVAALTGAGISAESGVPTFRGVDGLWKNFRAEDLATPEAFHRNPDLVWEWYDWRRTRIAQAAPNAGHLALAGLERFKETVLVTQNVDGLHALAGSKNLIELHGSIWRVRCTKCGRVWENRTAPLSLPPRCEACGGLLRPDVVWFGESLDSGKLEAAFASASKADVMLVIGTSALVQPAASLAYAARRAGGYVVEINVEATPFSDQADEVLRGPSGLILPLLIPSEP